MTEFISRKYGKEGYEIIIKTDSHDHYRATEEFERRLIGHAKPMRNADKIRAMTDEELAVFLSRGIEQCDYCQLAVFEGACTETLCDDAMMKWLQQPAEEERYK